MEGFARGFVLKQRYKVTRKYTSALFIAFSNKRDALRGEEKQKLRWMNNSVNSQGVRLVHREQRKKRCESKRLWAPSFVFFFSLALFSLLTWREQGRRVEGVMR